MKRLLLFLLFITVSSIFAGTVRQEVYHGEQVYTLENDKVILRIAPGKGGRTVSFYLKDRKQELVKFGSDEGFFIDHWAKYKYPSGLMHLKYHAEIVKIKGASAVRLSLTVPALGGGKGNRSAAQSLKLKTDDELIGLQIVKTIILKDGSDIVKVKMELRNPTEKSRSGAFHFQHGFRMTGNNQSFRWDIPSGEGIVGPVLTPGTKTIGKMFINDPVAGWFSVNDLKDFNMVFEFDYNYLDRTYSCGITGEWMMENIMLPAGKSFQTEYQVYPVSGFERVTFAKGGIAAGIRADETGTGIQIKTDLVSKSGVKNGMELIVRVYSHKNKTMIAEKRFAVGTLDSKIRTFTLEIPEKEEIVIKAVLSDGKDYKENFEYHYVNEKTEYNSRFFYGTMGAGAAVLAGGRGSAYRVKPPVKIKKMELPDFSKIKKFPGDKNRMLVLFGLYTDHLKIYETFRNDSGTEISWRNAHPSGIGSFPATFEELFRYRTIFMCNVNFKCLRFEGLEMIRHWISHGGTLVITGGFYSYGAGEYEGTPFEQFVPFINMKPFDLGWAGKGKSYTLRASGSHPELEGVDFSTAPDVPWLHKMQLKPGAVILAKAGEYPAIVKMKYGKGTVIACTMAPHGDPARPFWKGDGWKKFLLNCSKINQN